MSLGQLANLVASMPSWLAMIIQMDSLDVKPKDGGKFKQDMAATNKELVAALGKHLDKAREALQGTTDDQLMTTWKLLAGGKVVSEEPRHIAIRGSINHWAHHRGQLTVYLRMLNAPVPAVYGPTADEPDPTWKN